MGPFRKFNALKTSGPIERGRTRMTVGQVRADSRLKTIDLNKLSALTFKKELCEFVIMDSA